MNYFAKIGFIYFQKYYKNWMDGGWDCKIPVSYPKISIYIFKYRNLPTRSS